MNEHGRPDYFRLSCPPDPRREVLLHPREEGASRLKCIGRSPLTSYEHGLFLLADPRREVLLHSREEGAAARHDQHGRADRAGDNDRLRLLGARRARLNGAPRALQSAHVLRDAPDAPRLHLARTLARTHREGNGYVAVRAAGM